MKGRRRFLQLAGAAAVPVAVAAAQSDNSNANDIVGAWNTVHTLPPFPGWPPNFREFLSFGSGGVVQETNTFLYTGSILDFSAFGLPPTISASDGMGIWEHGEHGTYHIVFRKLLFDAPSHNFADLKVTGSATVNGKSLKVDWVIQVVETETSDVRVTLPPASSTGTRITA